MSDSAVHAEQLDFPSPSSPAYRWRPADQATGVRLSFDVVEYLEKTALENFRSLAARGSEIGGVLLGTVTAGEQPEVFVESCEPVECDYSRGPLYRLSANDRLRLDAVLRKHEGPGPAVVGFYRSHTRKGLSLDEEDQSLLGALFHGPSQIALLIRPFATKTSVAGIFLSEGGAFQGDASPLEFAFTVAELKKQMEREAVVAPKPAGRAQVVSIAPRREPGAEPDAAPAADSAAEVAEPPTAVAAYPPAPTQSPAPSLPEPGQSALPEVAPPLFGQKTTAPDGAGEKRSRGKLIGIGAGAGTVLAAVALFVYPGVVGRDRAKPGPGTSGLSLRAERTAGDLLVTWNRDSEAVRTAVQAVLTIADGAQHENLPLDLAQLRNGSIVYTPATPDVSFRLEVTSSDPAKSRSELLRVLKRPNEAAQTAKPAGLPNPAKPASPPPPEAPNPDAAPPRAPARPFNAASLETPAARVRAARPSDLPEPPPADSPAAPSALGLSGVGAAPASAPAPVPPAPTPAPAPAAKPPAEPVRVGGNVRPAELLTRREPVYPPLARQSRVGGVVVMDVRIGADGRVKSVTPLEGHPMLRGAAVEAVRQWTYKPASLNGDAVESNSRIEVRFVAGH
jgi:periplasmic protein TonB